MRLLFSCTASLHRCLPKNFILLGLVLGFVSCTSGKRAPLTLVEITDPVPTLAINQLPPVRVPDEALTLKFKPEVSLRPVVDQREETYLIAYNQREYLPRGNLSIAIDYALRKALQQRGITLKSQVPLVLETTILRWLAHKAGANLLADAVLKATLTSVSGEELYHAVYEGRSEFANTQMKIIEVEQTLGNAMGQALSEIVSDKKLLEIIASY